jgi:membrane protein
MPEPSETTYITRTELERATLPIWAFFMGIGGYLLSNKSSDIFLWFLTLFPFAVITFMFAVIYKLLPDVRIAWRNVWTGAAVTAVLFTIGKTLIGLYLGRSSVASVYGAAGSLIVLLLWVYYSAQVVFFGAEFTKVYAREHGSHQPKLAAAKPSPECGEPIPSRPPSGAAGPSDHAHH